MRRCSVRRGDKGGVEANWTKKSQLQEQGGLGPFLGGRDGADLPIHVSDQGTPRTGRLPGVAREVHGARQAEAGA